MSCHLHSANLFVVLSDSQGGWNQVKCDLNHKERSSTWLMRPDSLLQHETKTNQRFIVA